MLLCNENAQPSCSRQAGKQPPRLHLAAQLAGQLDSSRSHSSGRQQHANELVRPISPVGLAQPSTAQSTRLDEIARPDARAPARSRFVGRAGEPDSAGTHTRSGRMRSH